MDSSKRLAIITGGTGSLGRSIAQALENPDWTVRATGRADLDVTDAEAVRAYLSDLEVDLLVCAAGMTNDKPLARVTLDAWSETWAVNFRGAADCAHAVLPSMIRRNEGHIIFISSHSAKHPPVGQIAYAASKAALLGLVRDLAGRHGASNVRINAILPGFLETRMTRAVSESRRSEVMASHMLGRFNTVEQVARFIRFLHHELPHTSGQVFQLDSR